MSARGVILLAAGGTGGHLFPAQALAEELVARGFTVELATDERVRDYGKSFPASKVHVIPAATLSAKNILKLPGNALTLAKGYLTSRRVISQSKPRAVVGFGGYPSLPPLLAATRAHLPTLVHEANAVLGRANVFLSGRVQKVASSFPELKNLPPHLAGKLVFTGNPVRSVVLQQAASPFPKMQKLNLLVFGGSQGARFFSEFMPKVFECMEAAERQRFSVTQQCRAEDLPACRSAYEQNAISPDLQHFFMDLPQRIAASHLVVARSGASTVAELCVIGRPAVLVPLPHAIDNDQLRNAQYMEQAGAAWCMPQSSLDPKLFASQLTSLLGDPGKLAASAAMALQLGTPDAAKRLADELEMMIGA